jgi:anaerobic ribonucleoside-triphosphate reductase activating protein
MNDPLQLKISAHRLLTRTQAEGPGVRAALFVQGCAIRCPGCFNVETWDFNRGTWMTVGEIFETIAKVDGLEGVTFVGGEPMHQATALAVLGRLCRQRGLSIVTFSGFDYDQLNGANRQDWNELLSVTDLLLAGPYLRDQQDFSRPWVGSRNQQFVFLTDRYRHLENQLAQIQNRLEIRVTENGDAILNGLVPEAEIEALRTECQRLGLELTP